MHHMCQLNRICMPLIIFYLCSKRYVFLELRVQHVSTFNIIPKVCTSVPSLVNSIENYTYNGRLEALIITDSISPRSSLLTISYHRVPVRWHGSADISSVLGVVVDKHGLRAGYGRSVHLHRGVKGNLNRGGR